MNIQRCVDDLLLRGADDWVHMPEVAWVVRSVGGASTPDQIRDLSIFLIREVVQQGLMELGDLTKEGFRKWEMPMQECLARVEREWRALGRNPTLGEVCWLQNTRKDKERPLRDGAP